MKMKRITLLMALLLAVWQPAEAAKPRLVVQIVAGSLQADALTRYAENFETGGFRRLIDGGMYYTDSRYDYQQTLTPVSLATLTTGALPSTHGIIGSRWMDYTTNRPVELIDPAAPAPEHLVAPTLAETLLQQLPGSMAVTVAIEPMPAVMLSGRGGAAYWMNERCNWESSPYYMERLPDWVTRNNREQYNQSFIEREWRTFYTGDRYRNTHRQVITLSDSKLRSRSGKSSAGRAANEYEQLLRTPAGNSALLAFAKEAITNLRLGSDETTDLLNIYLDPTRTITETYGPESVEAEDMLYRLDFDLSDFLTFIYAQWKPEEVLVVFTADHGTSPSYDAGPHPTERFNDRQFAVIVNGFLNVRYGTGDWVLACENNSVWLNHNLIYERGLNLSEVQNEVAIFAMQFSGVSHALAATAMRTSYFGSGYARKMQNSFYPRRSGDVILNLMPGWIGERERCVSASGSLYGYDTEVPLLFYGADMPAQRIGRRVEMTAVTPTLARLIGITEPAASEGEILQEVVRTEQHGF